MRLLIKGFGNAGLAAHIPGGNGKPLCKAQIKLVYWTIRDRPENGNHVCKHCRHIQAKVEDSKKHTGIKCCFDTPKIDIASTRCKVARPFDP